MKHAPTQRTDIAVVGMSCRFPKSDSLESFWRLLSTGDTAFTPIDDSRWKHSSFLNTTDVRATDKTYVTHGAFIDDVDSFPALHHGLAPRRVQVMDPQQRLCIEATREALQDAGYEVRAFDKARTGVFIGASVSEYKDLMTARHRAIQMADGTFGQEVDASQVSGLGQSVGDVVPARAFTIAGSLLNMIACSVAQTFDLKGPAIQIDAACSSALVAIHEAALNLTAGQCNLAIAGGVYLNLTPDNLIGFSRIGAISASGVCRPFDTRADGFVMGEGIGVVVLKRLEDALRDGDRVYAVMKGTGCNNDGRGEGPMTPRSEGQQDAMRQAWEHVDFPHSSLGYIETHGTATSIGDAVEIGALRQFFASEKGEDQPSVRAFVGSVKANIGHTMSAAGVAGFIKTCLAIHHGVIPPQPGCEKPNVTLGLEEAGLAVSSQRLDWVTVPGQPRRAAVSSFGFGGTNAHVLLQEAPQSLEAREKPAQPPPVVPHAIFVSAPTKDLLAKHLLSLAKAAEVNAYSVEQVASTLARRAVFSQRLAFQVSTPGELIESLRRTAAALETDQTLPDGVKLQEPSGLPKVAFLFPGQGAQRVGLLQSVARRFDVLFARLKALDVASTAAAQQTPRASWLEALHPTATQSNAQAQAALTRTNVCQPAMAAMGLALSEMLQACNVKPAVVLGHSLGEFAAAATAGVFSAEAATDLVAFRGESMMALGLPDTGAMTAVMAPLASVSAVIPTGAEVVVANHNHPSQVVLSGTTAGIVKAEALLEHNGLKTKRLDVSHAFHSPLMRGIESAMHQRLESLPLREPHTLLVSCISGQPLRSLKQMRDLWTIHGTATVRFVDALQVCLDEGVTHFVQVGAGGALLSFVKGVAQPQRAVSTLSLAPMEGQDDGAQLLSTLSQLWLDGAAVSLLPLYTQSPVVTLPTTPLEKQKYWAIENKSSGTRIAAAIQAQPGATALPTQSTFLKAAEIPMNDVVALFEQQTKLLQSHADIVKAQAAAIQALVQGTPMPAASTVSMRVPAEVKTETSVVPAVSAAKPVIEKPVVAEPAIADVRPEVQHKLLTQISRISAFPVASVKLEQSLVGDLGFDSLMLVELDQEVGKAFPRVGGLPRELFSRETRVLQVVDYIVKALEGGGQKPVATTLASTEVEVLAPVERYVPTLVDAPLHSLSEMRASWDKPILVTRDAKGVGAAVVARFNERGLKAQLGDVFSQGEFAGVVVTDLANSPDYRVSTRALVSWAKKLKPESAHVFAVVTEFGGQFGYQGVSKEQLGHVGAWGFTKALAQEWPDAIVKAVDVDTSFSADVVAQHVVAELLSGDASVEVGITKRGRSQIALTPSERNADAITLTSDSVVVLTGGAKGLGLQFAKALAARYRCRIALAGRSNETDATQRAVVDVLAAGASACSYHVIDTRLTNSVVAGINAIRTHYSRIDAVVHAAGVVADGAVHKKEPSHIDAVLETKVGGALALLDATASDAVQVFLSVGSWAGRFGNAGQTDYSAANEMLARLSTNPSRRLVTVDFPPFEDSEMVRKIPAFRKAELKADNVTFLSNDEGVAAFLAAFAEHRGEVLVGRAIPSRRRVHRAAFPVSRLNHVYLNDHAMAGQHVLPLASAMDHLASAAVEASGYRELPLSLQSLQLKRSILVPDTTWLEVEVNQNTGSTPPSATLKLEQGRALCYTANAVFGVKSTTQPKIAVFEATPQLPLSVESFYRQYTFHGPKLQGIERIEALHADGVVGWVKGCQPSDWIKEPLRSTWTIDPKVIDASFQLAGYWAWVTQGRSGFPVGVEEFVQLKPFGLAPIKCTVTFTTSQEDVFVGTLVWQNEGGEVLAYMRGAKAEFKQRATPIAAERAGASPVVSSTVEESSYNPAKFPEYEELKERMQMAEAFGLKNPYFSVHEAICGDTTIVDGRSMVNFSSYNYVGNSGDPVVTLAAQDALAKYGSSVSASRVASGEKPLTRELEVALADFFGTEDCVVLVSGHATNVTVIGHVVGPGDLIVHDALAHDSIIQGAKLSGAKRRPFAHNDYKALDAMLTAMRGQYRRVLICIEGTYSMDGDIPDVPQFIALKHKHKALLLVDEAHSAGVVGATGRGVGEYFDVKRSDVDMWMGTLSKSFASCGGYIAGSAALVEYLKYTTPGFVYSVGISPPNAAAALAATQQMLAHPERVRTLQDNAAYFLHLLKDRGIDTGMSKDSAVVPAIVGNSVLCLQLSDALKKRGINVQPILYPAVEEELARLRFFVSSMHSKAQLLQTADILKEELERLKREMAA